MTLPRSDCSAWLLEQPVVTGSRENLNGLGSARGDERSDQRRPVLEMLD